MNGSAGNNGIYRQWIAVGRIFLQAESTRKWMHPKCSRFDWCKLIAQVLKTVLQQRPGRRRFAEPGWRHQSDRMTAKSNHRRMDEIKIWPEFLRLDNKIFVELANEISEPSRTHRTISVTRYEQDIGRPGSDMVTDPRLPNRLLKRTVNVF